MTIFAKTVCIAFENWNSEKETAVYSEEIPITADYESGAFYKKRIAVYSSFAEKNESK